MTDPTKSRAAFEAALWTVADAAKHAGRSRTDAKFANFWSQVDRAAASALALYDQAAQSAAADAPDAAVEIEGEIYMIDGQESEDTTALIGIEVNKDAYHATADALRTIGARVRVVRLPSPEGEVNG